MFVRQNQLTPYHYHVQKTEDIIKSEAVKERDA